MMMYSRVMFSASRMLLVLKNLESHCCLKYTSVHWKIVSHLFTKELKVQEGCLTCQKIAPCLKPDQCDQIGRFMIVLDGNFHAKVAQIYGDFLGYFENVTFQVKTAVTTLFGANFYSIIWSPLVRTSDSFAKAWIIEKML